MIYFYSGTPGSGKSLQMAHEVCRWIKSYKRNVIANTMISVKNIMGKSTKEHGRFYYLSNDKFTPDFLYRYAIKFHDLGVEHQTLIVIDEAQVLFGPTAIKLYTQENKAYRQEWLEFFTQHRHLGFDVLIISQFDRLIDAQIRCLFEYNYVHRKANNFRTIGKILTILGISLFVQIQHWYGVSEVCGTLFFTYSKKYSQIYDSYAYRNQIIAKLTAKYGEEVMKQLMGFKKSKNGKLPKVKPNEVSEVVQEMEKEVS